MATKYWVGGDGAAPNDWDTAANWEPAIVPASGDAIFIQGSQSILDNVDRSANDYTDFEVLPDYTGALGSQTEPLIIDVDTFKFAGQGLAYIVLDASMALAIINNTAQVSTGDNAGLWLSTSTAVTLTTLRVNKGIVAGPIAGLELTLTNAFASFLNNQSTDVRLILNAAAAVTNYRQTGGNNLVRCDLASTIIDGGVLTTEAASAQTAIILNAGTLYPNATGTIAAITVNNGLADFTRSREARTVTAATWNGGRIIKRSTVTWPTTTLGGDIDGTLTRI